MKSKFLLDSFLECLSLFEGQGVRLCDNGHDVDDIRQLLENDDVNRFQTANSIINTLSTAYHTGEDSRVTRWLNKEQAAMNPGILNVALALGGKLLSKIS